MNWTMLIQAVIAGGLFAFIEFLIKRSDEKKNKGYVTREDFDPIKEGILALLQERLEHSMTKALNEGEVSPTQLKSTTVLLQAYEKMGGDGYIHELYEQYKQLM